MMKFDYIIVGQGIAGTMLSWFLLKRDKKVLVIDQFNAEAASNVAAGIINPVTGRKLTKSWLIEELIPFCRKVYDELSEELGDQFYVPKDIIKIFTSEKEATGWLERLDEQGVQEYVQGLPELPGYEEKLNLPYGAVIINQAGFVLLKHLIACYRIKLKQLGLLLEEPFDFSKLALPQIASSEEAGEACIKYQGFEAGRIVFCEGFQGNENPFFPDLPFALTKGEVLTLKIPDLPEDFIINNQYWLVPLGSNRFRAGATYNWDILDGQPTAEAKGIILDKIRSALKVEVEVISHDAAVRPTVRDRKPIVGRSPKHRDIFILNGLGSKGATYGPYFAHHLVQHMEEGAELMEEVRVRTV